jgi:hypothetical protein
MGKLKDLAAVKSTAAASFAYLPPDKAINADLILVVADIAYPLPHPVTVSQSVLGAVLRGLRRASPTGRIVLVGGIAVDTPVQAVFGELGIPEMLDREMRYADTEELLDDKFSNKLKQPFKFAELVAPGYLHSYDCVINLSTLKRTSQIAGASLLNLFSLMPRRIYSRQSEQVRGQLFEPDPADSLKDVYFTLGEHIDGVVIDLTEKYLSADARFDHADKGQAVGQVLWGEDMLALDEAAFRIAGEEVPPYIEEIRALNKAYSARE